MCGLFSLTNLPPIMSGFIKTAQFFAGDEFGLEPGSPTGKNETTKVLKSIDASVKPNTLNREPTAPENK